ncbi:MAG: type II toxin-antitoxin system HicB family antitoxin, partial [Treponema sp.]|nr:type II toxin-antitoxin system HicB family antitoxin [Treponema sp.]
MGFSGFSLKKPEKPQLLGSLRSLEGKKSPNRRFLWFLCAMRNKLLGGMTMTYNCTIEQEGDMFIVQFPDMPNIQTYGNTREEALAMAQEALEGCLESDISRGLPIPPPAYKEGYSVPVA